MLQQKIFNKKLGLPEIQNNSLKFPSIKGITYISHSISIMMMVIFKKYINN